MVCMGITFHYSKVRGKRGVCVGAMRMGAKIGGVYLEFHAVGVLA